MSMLDQITPVILTRNEEANIGRTLDQLQWATRIVVVDSFSSDRTVEVASSYPPVQVFQRRFESHGDQWNFAMQQAATEWVLALDADYIVPDRLAEELRSLQPADGINGYEAPFRYCVFGRPLRGTLYPAKPVLLRRSAARYIQDGHTQRPIVDGALGALRTAIFHDDRKPLREFLTNQDRYMGLEAQKVRRSSFGSLSWTGKIRKLVIVAPPAAFLFTLLIRGTILDGWRGWYYALQRLIAESILSLKLIEAALGFDPAPRQD